MKNKLYKSPKAALVLPDVLCEISFPLDGSGAEIANGKETSITIDYVEDEDNETYLNWFDYDDLWLK